MWISSGVVPIGFPARRTSEPGGVDPTRRLIQSSLVIGVPAGGAPDGNASGRTGGGSSAAASVGRSGLADAAAPAADEDGGASSLSSAIEIASKTMMPTSTTPKPM